MDTRVPHVHGHISLCTNRYSEDRSGCGRGSSAIDAASQFRPVDGGLVRVHHRLDQLLTMMSKKRNVIRLRQGEVTRPHCPDARATSLSLSSPRRQPRRSQKEAASGSIDQKPTSQPPSQAHAKRCYSGCTTTGINLGPYSDFSSSCNSIATCQ